MKTKIDRDDNAAATSAKEGDDREGESRMNSRGFLSWFFGRSEASLLMFTMIL